MSKSKFIVLAYPLACFSGKISRTGSVQNDFSLNNIEQKDIRRCPLSDGETRRSLALAVLQLLKLRTPLFNSGADISWCAAKNRTKEKIETITKRMKKKNRKNDNLNVATSQFSPFPIF
jgi:hypothetical protein